MELEVPTDISSDTLREQVAALREDRVWIDNITVTRTQEGTALVRTATQTNEEHQQLLAQLTSQDGIRELRYTTIGPTVGATLKQRSLWALGAAAIAIVLYLTFAFRKVPRHLNPWKFGLAAIAALIHDIIITLGIFSVLSHVTSFQLDTLFVTALLSIMGYSVNDTIIIFDRLRDNLLDAGKKEPLGTIAARSLRQSLARTFNTTLSTLVVLFALLFIGSESIRWFVLTLIVGTAIGTYSSFFVATPLLVLWRQRDS